MFRREDTQLVLTIMGKVIVVVFKKTYRRFAIFILSDKNTRSTKNRNEKELFFDVVYSFASLFFSLERESPSRSRNNHLTASSSTNTKAKQKKTDDQKSPQNIKRFASNNHDKGKRLFFCDSRMRMDAKNV